MYYFPSKTDAMELKAFTEPYCVTIYAPYIDELAGINPNKLQLKNMLQETERRLITSGLEPKIVRKTTARARALLNKKEFWHLRGASLAVFAHPKFFRYYLIPSKGIVYRINIGQGFEIEPLLNLIENDQVYYVLAVSHNNIRFYQGGHHTIKQIVLKNLPTNLKEDLRIDEYPNETESHAVAPAGGTGRSEAFHGQYNEKEVDKEYLFRFFRHIDTELHKYLRDKKNPLIFAGVEYLMPIYKKANTYPHLMSEAIKGNPERKDINLIREQAWALLSTKNR